MSDNATLPAAGQMVATDEVTYSGDTAQVQLVRVVTVSGAEGSKTVGGTDPLVNIDVDLGGPTTAAAPADGTGDYAIIAGIKRLALGMAQALTNWTTLLARIPAALGQGTMAQSLSVVLASDQATLPTSRTVPTASGTITAQNTVPNGVATAGSAVEIVLGGATSISVQTTGTYTGALSLQVTLDGTRWETVTGAVITNMLSGVASATIVSATVGVFTAPVHGALRARITGLAAMTGTATVTMRGLPAPTVAYMVQPTAANLNVTASGTVTANIGTGSLAAGTNAIGDVGLQVRANATGAASTSHIVSAASTNTANVKASAGRLLGWSFVNTTASYQYVKLHNTAGTPTAGAGVVQTIAIPPNGVNNCPPTLPGIAFTTGIGRSIVTGSADADATATTAGAVVGDLFFA